MTTTNENLIINKCLQGCRSSFEKLVHTYQSHVIALSVNILGNYDEALDSTQDTFVQAYVNLNRFDRERKFKSWLLSIAAKRCLDSLRKKKSIRNYFIKQTKEFHPHSHDSYQHFKPVEESEIFFPLLKKMKDNERVAVLLKVNECYGSSAAKKSGCRCCKKMDI
ncbi:MAG: sigma-70 family RNA polymerase sigma factor [bacterium]|nr:sigma-70 family RNA polymerase sigma factor [bacterium]